MFFLPAVTSGALFIASFSAVANAISSGMETCDDDASPGAASSSTWARKLEFDNIAHVLLSLVVYDTTGSSLSKAPSLGISRLEGPHARWR